MTRLVVCRVRDLVRGPRRVAAPRSRISPPRCQNYRAPTKVTIIGGSQGTGARVAEASLAAGHDVTVLSRREGGPSGVTTVLGDATEPGPVREAVAGADAVGGATGGRHHRAAVTRTVVEAMQDEGVRRLVVQSSLGAGDSGSQMPLPLRVVMKALLARPLAQPASATRRPGP